MKSDCGFRCPFQIIPRVDATRIVHPSCVANKVRLTRPGVLQIQRKSDQALVLTPNSATIAAASRYAKSSASEVRLLRYTSAPARNPSPTSRGDACADSTSTNTRLGRFASRSSVQKMSPFENDERIVNCRYRLPCLLHRRHGAFPVQMKVMDTAREPEEMSALQRKVELTS